MYRNTYQFFLACSAKNYYKYVSKQKRCILENLTEVKYFLRSQDLKKSDEI